MTNATTPVTEVLIVGAGPTGLVLAAELSRRQVPFRLIDQRSAPSTKSKALGLHARTLECLESLGVVREFLDRGLKIHDANIYADGRRLTRISMDEIDSGFPFVLSLPQEETEQILIRHLEAAGQSVEREIALEAVKTDTDQVCAVVRHKDGRGEEIRCRWLVGCDGAHSSVRNDLGIPFEGTEFGQGFLLADARVRWNLAPDEIHTFFTEDGFVGFIPLPNGLTRVVLNLGESTPTVSDEQPTLEEMQLFLRERGLFNIFLEDPAWLSRFYVHYRMVPQYRLGRVFLVGDAAHVHSPLGGQGMNTGIQDAVNLAWKLELVIKGVAQPDFLDSYHAERHGVAANLLRATDKATRFASLRHPVAQSIRNRIASFLTSFEGVQDRFTQSVAMLGINYRHSPIVAESRPRLFEANLVKTDAESEEPNFQEWREFVHGPRPGDRAPDWSVRVLGSEEPRPLFQLLRGSRHHLLLFDGFNTSPDGYLNLRAIARGVQQEYDHLIEVHIVVPAATPPPALQWDGSLILDPEGDLHHRYGAGSECLYLVRPDGYIGFRCQPAEWLDLKAYLQKWFSRPA